MRMQTGATLAIALIMLLIITLLGISALQVTQMQEKMSANLADKTQSFIAAESALIAGEAWVLGLTTEPTAQTPCSSSPCVQKPYTNINLTTQTTSWWQTNSTAYSSTLQDIATPPRYLVEYLQFVPDTPMVGSSAQKSSGVFYYQVTAKGTGDTDNAVTVLQSTVARRF